MATRRISNQTARRLFITKQRLAGPRLPATSDGLLEAVRSIGVLQIDPTRVVARTQHLVLWSRLGVYNTALLDKVAYEDRSLFEYWGHAWSYVMAEHLPIHKLRMTTFAKDTNWGEQVRTWMKANDSFRRYILAQLRRHGPLQAKDLEDRSVAPWPSSGWTNDRSVSRMLDFLSAQGKALVSARRGPNRLWDIGERCLPRWASPDKLSETETVRRAAEISLKTLGVARMGHIKENFTRGMYPNLPRALTALEREQKILPVSVDGPDGEPTKDGWWVHHDDLELLGRIEDGEWEPRVSLLSPFDNLIADRKRLLELFGFHFRLEIYVPVAKRQYGFFVLPVLDGDRLVGRIDPAFDRKLGVLTVNAIHQEPGAPWGKKQKTAVTKTIEDLGSWLGATSVRHP